MIDLLLVLILGAVALPWIAVNVMCRRADMESMDCRAWINYLADRSRKKGRFFAGWPVHNDKRRTQRWIGMGF